jgi:hypothetical protein
MSTSPAAGPSKSGHKEVVEEQPHAVSEASSSKVWQLVLLLVPIFLTTWLTYSVSQKEDNIKQKIDEQSQLFSQQVQLSEELYKRRFDAYDKLYVQLVQLNGKLDPDKRSEESKSNTDSAIELSELLELSKLHMSSKVEWLAGEAFLAAARQDGPALSQRMEDLRAAMKAELDEKMLEDKGAAPAAANAPAKPKQSKLKTRSSQ